MIQAPGTTVLLLSPFCHGNKKNCKMILDINFIVYYKVCSFQLNFSYRFFLLFLSNVEKLKRTHL